MMTATATSPIARTTSPFPATEQALKRLAAALVADAIAIQPRWRTGAARYPGTVPVEAVEQALADHPHATVEVGTLTVAAWMEGRSIRLATISNGVALVAYPCDIDSLDRLKRWTASRLSNEMRH